MLTPLNDKTETVAKTTTKQQNRTQKALLDFS
jgi:hypothetical protein